VRGTIVGVTDPSRLVEPPTTSDPPTTRSGPAATDRGFRPWHRTAWTVLNATTAPVWLAMILAPRSRCTAALVRRVDVVLAGLGTCYVALLAAGIARGEGGAPDLSDPASVAAGLGVPEAFLAGWTHYLAFDLLAGRWIWESSLAAGRTARLPLLLTWWAGPAGVTLHLARRRRWRR
jgi:hypothetical protein